MKKQSTLKNYVLDFLNYEIEIVLQCHMHEGCIIHVVKTLLIGVIVTLY